MTQGLVNADYEAVIPLTVQGPSGQSREIEAVVNTGFNDFLTLPTELVADLGMIYRNRGQMILADGSEATFDVYMVTVLWDDEVRQIYAYAADATPLVGMRLMRHHTLNIEIDTGGRVLIQPIPN